MHQYRLEYSPEGPGGSRFSPKLGIAYMTAESVQAEPDLRSYDTYDPGGDRIFVPNGGNEVVRIDRETVTYSEIFNASAEIPIFFDFYEKIPFIQDLKLNFGMGTEDSQRDFEQLQWLRDTTFSNNFPLGPGGAAAPTQSVPAWIAPAPGVSGPFLIREDEIATTYAARGFNDLQDLLDFYNSRSDPRRGPPNDDLTVNDLIETSDGSLALSPNLTHTLVSSSDLNVPFSQNDANGGVAYTIARGTMSLDSMYVSADWQINDMLKANLGLRHEEYELIYDDDDNFPGVVIGSPQFVIQDIDAESVSEDITLPTYTLIVEPTDSISFRMTRSETTSRPTYREVAPFISLNPNEGVVELGNPGSIFIGNAPPLDPYVDRNGNGIPDTGDNIAGSTVFTTGGAAQPIFDFDRNGQDYFISPTGTGIIRNPDYVESNDYSGLTTGLVQNLDIRLEYSPGDYLFAVTAFYKEVSEPIEQVSLAPPGDVGASTLTTYINNENDATIEGFELEAQTSLAFILMRDDGSWLENIGLGANYTIIDAKVERTTLEKKLATQGGDAAVVAAFNSLGDERNLFDQPERLANAFVSLNVPEWGSRFTVSGTLTGRQLQVVGSVGSHPDLYLEETIGVNFVWEQELTDHISLKFSAKNINSPELKLVRDEDFVSALRADGGNVSNQLGGFRSSYETEPTYSISVSGKF